MSLSRHETSKARKALAAQRVETHSLRNRPDACAPPRALAALGFRLNCCKSKGAASLAAAASFAIEHPYDIAFGTARSVADRCSVSSTSVVRLALSLGFQGFHDMREFFRRPLRASATSGGHSSFDASID